MWIPESVRLHGDGCRWSRSVNILPSVECIYNGWGVGVRDIKRYKKEKSFAKNRQRYLLPRYGISDMGRSLDGSADSVSLSLERKAMVSSVSRAVTG